MLIIKQKKEVKKMQQKRMQKNSKGITLIALVITIIVLLILAGVTIATLTGDNGILTQAGNAKEQTEKADIIERAKVEIVGVQSENNGELPKEDLDRILKSYDKDGTIRIDDEGNRYIVTSKNYKILASDIWSKETPVIVAKKVLKTDSTATEAKDKSPYVLYNNILCRVLYNDDTHGIQIISADNVGNVTLGNGDTLVGNADFEYDGSVTINDNFKLAATSYNKAVTTLNNKAKTYKNSTALDARCLGSDPVPTNGVFAEDVAGYWSRSYEYLKKYGWNDKFKTSDTKYKEDVAKLNSLGLNISTDSWLASRYVSSYSSYTCFDVRSVSSSGDTNDEYLCYVDPDGSVSSYSPSNAFRPVFLLPSGVIISGGDGSSENPYVIE
jgi:type II secretory pathway pseudopilin PulG